MEYRPLGKTGLTVSALGFGCGAVGGMMVGGTPDEQRRTIAHAIERGITYFDTAPSYGNGRSEENLGRVLEDLQADVIVGTKVRLDAGELDDIPRAVVASVERSLKRLRRERVDLIQLHNPLAAERKPEHNWLSVADLGAVAAAFEALQRAGKVGAWGITALGETDVLHHALDSGAQSIQVCYNLINPSAGVTVPSGFPFQDYQNLLDRAAERGIGAIAIRVLAGGALSGSTDRHALAAQNVDPISSGDSLAADATWSQRFAPLVAAGYADSLVEAAIRFALGNPAISTGMVGISSLEQLDYALDAAERGPLPENALARLHAIWQGA